MRGSDGARDLDIDQNGGVGAPVRRGREAGLLVEVGVGGEAHVVRVGGRHS